MRSHKGTIFLVLFTSAVAVMTAAATIRRSAQEPAPKLEQRRGVDRQRQEFERRFPAVDFEKPEPADPEERARRRIKNSRYDKFGFSVRHPSPRVGEESFETEWSLHLEALPASKSTAIVIGEVLSAEAHLSNDKNGIYSEFAVRVDEVLKNAGPAQLQPGSSVTVDRAGGFVSYPNGHQTLYRVDGQNMPGIGQRYLLFLDASGQSPNYRVVTGYELGGSGVAPLDESMGMNKYKGMDEASFLNAVRAAVAQTSPPAP